MPLDVGSHINAWLCGVPERSVGASDNSLLFDNE